ncbi:MAG: EAL domain-containing protein, partial [Gammaproteobacteria bacterium]
LAAAMPGAWESGEISLAYQPLVRLIEPAVVGVQPLLRWDHPQRGLLPHQECLDLASRTGLALSLGQWMLHTACEQFASWQQRHGGPRSLLHIDLTAAHAHDPDLVTTVGCALDRAGLARDCLQIGIPVSALDAEHGEAAENLQLLADLGVAIALLGCSGAGAIAHLEDLPALAVELAPRIVQRVATRGAASAVGESVTPLLRLMHGCGATVIVRGIETQDQADWWRSAGADIGQGGFFAPPGPPDVITALLGPSG